MNIVKPALPDGWTFFVAYDEELGAPVIKCSGPGYNWTAQVVKSSDPQVVEKDVNSILAGYAEMAVAAEKARTDWPKKQLAETQDRATAKAMVEEIKKTLPVAPPKQAQGR
jgi:hypothetical protein